MFARFCAADHQLASEKLLIVQFVDRALRFFNGLHLDEGETLRALVVAIAHHLGVLNVTDSVEEFKEIALRRIERQIANVEARRSDFD